MSRTNMCLTESLPRPLCCRYLLAIFENTSVKVGEGTTVCDEVLQWGIGVLCDGQQELLGVWRSQAGGGSAPQWVFGDLQLRGVEKIEYVTGVELENSLPTARVSFPGAHVMPSSNQLLRHIEIDFTTRERAEASRFVASLYAAGTFERAEIALLEFAAGLTGRNWLALVDHYSRVLERLAPFYALAPRFRGIVRRVDLESRQLSRRVTRAVNRRGGFQSVEAATSLVAKTLAFAQSDLSAVNESGVVKLAHLASRTSPISAATASCI